MPGQGPILAKLLESQQLYGNHRTTSSAGVKPGSVSVVANMHGRGPVMEGTS